jgi:ribosomal protein S18 acetylase RimI-like enzyme
MEIIKSEKITDETYDFIDKILFDEAKTNKLDFAYNNNSFLIYDDKSETDNKEKKLIGAVTLQTFFNEVYIDGIVIIPEYRNKGIGTWILNEIENHYKNDGYKSISLFTYKFQAPEFYQKNGFTLEFVRESETNSELTKYFFVKKIS